MSKEITIDGIKYINEKDVSQHQSENNRHVVVIDRGWIFAGDLTEKRDPHGDLRIILTNVVWVFKWNSIGFSAAIENPFDENVDLRPMDQIIDIPKDTEIFRIPVPSNWGIKK